MVILYIGVCAAMLVIALWFYFMLLEEFKELNERIDILSEYIYEQQTNKKPDSKQTES